MRAFASRYYMMLFQLSCLVAVLLMLAYCLNELHKIDERNQQSRQEIVCDAQWLSGVDTLDCPGTPSASPLLEP